MKTLDLKQGSDEWHAARLEKRTASEAPAMMGASKYMSRNDLLKLKKTGIAEEVSSFQQSIFDRGHASEASIRFCAEEIVGEDLYPVTGLSDEHPALLASFDGLTFDEDVAFEHKLWNETLAQNVRNGVLEDHYVWQLEQQLLVANAEKVLFIVSDGTPEKMVHMWYYPQEGYAEKLLAGWAQFDKDLEAYEVEVKAEVIEANVADLPIIQASVSGTEISTNIKTVIDQVKEFAAAEMAKPLETDLDFANKEALVKKVKAARDTLKAKVADIRNGFGSFEEFSSAAEELDGILQKLQSASEKEVKAKKEKIKVEIVDKAGEAFEAHFAQELLEFNDQVGTTAMSAPTIRADLEAAIKGKRNLDSMKSACDDVVAKAKIDFDEHLSTMQARWKALKESAGDYLSQVGDISTILQMEVDHLRLHVSSTVNEIKQAEQARLQREQEAQTEPPPTLEAVSVEQQLEEHFPSGEVTQGPANPPVINPIESRIARHLFDHHGVTQAQARAIAKALINNEIPGINVAANQSVA